MFKEDNNGFVYFPNMGNMIKATNDGKTLIYLVSFDAKYGDKDLSNIIIKSPGLFVSDDVVTKSKINNDDSIPVLIEKQKKNVEYDSIYFINDELQTSINFITCICIGWHNNTFIDVRNGEFWVATFRDLTNSGQRLYYTIKKLHNNKETRILTFNNIKSTL